MPVNSSILRGGTALALILTLLIPSISPAAARVSDPPSPNPSSVHQALYGGVFRDIWDSKFRDDIVWLANHGITTGCSASRFCPGTVVRRDQMATFLSRAMSLPTASTNWFSDTSGNSHEAAINRIADARVTIGCATRRYCPRVSVTRAQMATFIARAFALPRASRDYFSDDAGSVHEDAINRLAAAGITRGCASGRFCPQAKVKREQMAAFIRRSLVPERRLPTPSAPSVSGSVGQLLIPTAQLMSLPTSGRAWTALVSHASAFSGVTLADQNDQGNVRLLAWALVTVRTGGDVRPIHQALAKVPGTERGGRTLALGRNLAAVVLAADLVGYRDPSFVRWVRDVRHANLDGRTLVGTHEERPNNWGTHAGASRIAAALYLGDSADLGQAAAVFRGWLGERSAYAGFKYGELDWQANPAAPVGVNPRGATKNGHSIDGVLPDDQRRSETGFVWPPPKENYVYGALQGALLQAELLHRAGYPAYRWGDRALARAYRWLHVVADFPASGDDVWQPHLVNARYGTAYPAQVPSRPGKNFGFTDWLYR